MDTWYLLYGGTSEDGSGPGTYMSRTTDKTAARRHYTECRKNPYSVGKVTIITDTKLEQASPWTDWKAIP
jgi:hypothetical protein